MALFQDGVVENGKRQFGRAFAILVALVVFFVSYGVIAVRFGADPTQDFGIAALMVFISALTWAYNRRDNYRAERKNDKTLVVGTFTEDVMWTVIVVGSVALVLAFAEWALLGILVAAPLAAFLGYGAGQHIWKQVK